MPTTRTSRLTSCLLCAGSLFLLMLLTISTGPSIDTSPLPALAAHASQSTPFTHTLYLPLVRRHVVVPPLLLNGSFEGGTWRETLTGEVYGEISVPENWIAFWNTDDCWGRPEMRTIQTTPPYLDPPRIYSGTQALSWFTFFRNGDAGVYQQVPADAGRIYRAQGYAHVWYSQGDDEHVSEWHDQKTDTWHTIPDGDPGMEVMIGLDPTGGQDPWSKDVIWTSENIYDQYNTVSVQATAEAPTMTVFVRARTLYPFKHTDAYWDEVALEVLE